MAFFGGSFDPPHRGHVTLARLARARLALDRVLVAPVAAQPLKQELPPAGFADRLAMTALAFADEPETEVSLIDALRPDGRSNYTLDTLKTLQERLTPGDRLFCILGADSLLTIRQWHKPVELLTTCDFIVGARPGFDLGQAQSALPPEMDAATLATELPHTHAMQLTTPQGRRSCLYLLTDLAEDVSATQIRMALRDGASGNGVLATAVLDYIREHRLYTHL